MDSILPIVFQSKSKDETLLRSMWRTVQAHHPCFNVFSLNGPKSREFKMRKCLHLFTLQSMSFFIIAVFFDLNFPDNEALCNSFSTPEQCTQDKSMFDHSVHTCVWVDGGQGSFLCTSNSISFTLRVSLSQT